MHNIVLVFHAILAITLVFSVLLQQGKGADAGASFGSGASQTLFGSHGTGTFLSRTTAILATLFFATSFGLAIIAKNEAVAPAAPFSATTTEIPAAPQSSTKLAPAPQGAQLPEGIGAPKPLNNKPASKVDADIPVKK